MSKLVGLGANHFWGDLCPGRQRVRESENQQDVVLGEVLRSRDSFLSAREGFAKSRNILSSDFVN